jgi:hypothetical protein
MRIEYSDEEILRAFEIVRQSIGDTAQMNDYYNSGDKDTLREVTEDVFRKYDVPKKLTHIKFESYCEKYKDEIKDLFDKTVIFGKEERIKLDIVMVYLKKQHETYFDKPSLKIEESFDIELDLDDLPF